MYPLDKQDRSTFDPYMLHGKHDHSEDTSRAHSPGRYLLLMGYNTMRIQLLCMAPKYNP